jgi:hypothetical protein
VCRSLKVLCVASDEATLAAVRLAAVSAEWELAPGATTEEDALEQLHEVRPHVVVVCGPFEGFVAKALEVAPYLRVIADRELPGAGVVVESPDEIREAIAGRRRPGGPIR